MDERPAPSDSAEGPVGAYLVATEPIARRIADALAEALDPHEAASAAVAEPDGTWGVEITFQRAPDEAAVRALVSIAAGEECGDALCFRPLARQDWVASSLAGLDPVVAGRFIVHGAHSRAEIRPNHIAIEIEAALAFGTGHHGTTRGCLLALDRVVKRHGRKRVRRSESTQSYRILDLGTGTGVLAIAAVKAFRVRALASDLDRWAVITARQNAGLNKVPALLDVIQAAGVSAKRFRESGPFDLIFANILLRPLQQLAAPLARLVAPGGQLVLSGLLAPQGTAALATYRAQGLVLERRLLVEGWATLVLRRPAHAS
jgi:ribosomal protein L11 methyltransferase